MDSNLKEPCDEINPELQGDLEIYKLRMENSFLKKLLEEAEIKYNLLYRNNQLLEENKKLLEERLNSVQSQQTKVNNQIAVDENLKGGQKAAIAQESYKSMTKKSLKGQSKQGEKVKVSATNTEACGSVDTDNVGLADAQMRKMNELIHLNTCEGGGGDGFRPAVSRSKRRSTNRKIYGGHESKGDGVEFAEQRRVWLYLSRIKRHIGEEDIKKFISKQDKYVDADVIVKELPTSENQLKCFMFGIDWSFREDIYDPSSWPRGVAIKRFNFSKYRSYQNNRPSDFS